jgi:hypothetical protein
MALSEDLGPEIEGAEDWHPDIDDFPLQITEKLPRVEKEGDYAKTVPVGDRNLPLAEERVVFDELYEASLHDISHFNFEKLPGLPEEANNQLALNMVKSGGIRDLSYNLYYFHGLGQEVAEALIDKGMTETLSDFVSCFKNLDHSIALQIASEAETDSLLNNLDAFRNLSKEDILSIIDKSKGNDFRLLGLDFSKIPDLTAVDLAKELIKRGMVKSVATSSVFFKSEDSAEVVSLMCKEGLANNLLEHFYLIDIKGEDIKIIKDWAVENQKAEMVIKLMGLHVGMFDERAADLLVDAGFTKELTEKFLSFTELSSKAALVILKNDYKIAFHDEFWSKARTLGADAAKEFLQDEIAVLLLIRKLEHFETLPIELAEIMLKKGKCFDLMKNLDKFPDGLNWVLQKVEQEENIDYLLGDLLKFYSGLEELDLDKQREVFKLCKEKDPFNLITNFKVFDKLPKEELRETITGFLDDFSREDTIIRNLDQVKDLLTKEEIEALVTKHQITVNEILLGGGVGAEKLLASLSEVMTVDELIESSVITPETWEGVYAVLRFIERFPNSRKLFTDLAADFKTDSINQDIRGGVETMGSIRDTLHELIPKLKIDDLDYRTLIKSIPKGGDSIDIPRVRNDALRVEAVNREKLEVIHEMIHNFPGPKNLDVLRVYIKFLKGETGPDEYNSLIEGLGGIGSWTKLEEADREEILPSLEIAISLEKDLSRMYESSVKDLRGDIEKWKETVDLPELEEKVDLFYQEFAKNTPEGDKEAIKLLLEARKLLQAEIGGLGGEARTQTYYLDLGLEGIGYSIFSRIRERLQKGEFADNDELVEIITSGMALSELDGFKTKETSRLVQFTEGLSEEGRKAEQRKILSDYAEESAVILKGLGDRIKPVLEEKLKAKYRRLRRPVTDVEIKKETEQDFSGYYRGSVFNMVNDLINEALVRLPEPKNRRVSAREMMEMLGN